MLWYILFALLVQGEHRAEWINYCLLRYDKVGYTPDTGRQLINIICFPDLQDI